MSYLQNLKFKLKKNDCVYPLAKLMEYIGSMFRFSKVSYGFNIGNDWKRQRVI